MSLQGTEEEGKHQEQFIQVHTVEHILFKKMQTVLHHIYIEGKSKFGNAQQLA